MAKILGYLAPPAKDPRILDNPFKYSQVVILKETKFNTKQNYRDMLSLVRDENHLPRTCCCAQSCYWTSPSVWKHVLGMLHSELERTHILNYVCPLLLGTSCTANTAVSHHKCAPPHFKSLYYSCSIFKVHSHKSSWHHSFNLTWKPLLVRWSIPENTPGTVKHYYSRDSNFPEGGHRWGHIILGKFGMGVLGFVEWGCRFFL